MSFLPGLINPIKSVIGSLTGSTASKNTAQKISDAADEQAKAITDAADKQVAAMQANLAAQTKQIQDQKAAADQALAANVDQRGLAIKMQQLMDKNKQDAPGGPDVDLSVADPGDDSHDKYQIHKALPAVVKPVAAGFGTIHKAPEGFIPTPTTPPFTPPFKPTPAPGGNGPNTVGGDGDHKIVPLPQVHHDPVTIPTPVAVPPPAPRPPPTSGTKQSPNYLPPTPANQSQATKLGEILNPKLPVGSPGNPLPRPAPAPAPTPVAPGVKSPVAPPPPPPVAFSLIPTNQPIGRTGRAPIRQLR